MKTATVDLSWHLFVECPTCKKTMDLVDQDDENYCATAIFHNKWDDMKGEEFTCPFCSGIFEVEKVEY